MPQHDWKTQLGSNLFTFPESPTASCNALAFY